MPPPSSASRRFCPPWKRPWRFHSFWFACFVFLLLALGGALEGWQHTWRAASIGVARHVRPQFPDPNDPAIPLCVLFAKYRESPTAGSLPSEGRFSEDPAVMTARLARLFALLAQLPEDYRPRAVGLDMVLAGPGTEADPYLAAALARIPHLVLSATEEQGAPDGVLGPNSVFRVPSALVGIDSFRVPAWTLPSAQPRLYATVETDLSERGTPMRSLGVELAIAADASLDEELHGVAELPLYYWNLHEPASSATVRSGESLVGLWPAEAALFLTHAPVDEEGIAWQPMVPLWEENETPEQWLARVETALAEEGAWGAWQDYIGPLLGGRLLLVGVGLPLDVVPTPFTSRLYQSPHRQNGAPPLTPGVVLHALTAATLLNHRAPCDLAGFPLSLLAALLAGGLAWYQGMRLKPRHAGFVLLAEFAVLCMVDFCSLVILNAWLPAVPVLLAFALFSAAGVHASWHLVRESRERAAGWVQRLLPTPVLGAVAGEEDDYPAAGGVRQTAWRTVLRTDMAGYTDFVRALELHGRHDLALELVGEFFMTSVPVLDRFGGRLTDLTGDGIVVLFDQGEPTEEALQAFRCAVELIDAFRGWRQHVERRCKEEGAAGAPLPGMRVAVCASDTSFRLIGTEKQQKPLFFGGSFILSARIEAKIKELPLPGGADPVARFAVEGTIARLVHESGEPLLGFAPGQQVLLKGIQSEVEIVQVIVPPSGG